MKKTIKTCYVGPTNTKPVRITANDGEGNTAWVRYPLSKQGGDAYVYEQAAEALLEKMGWEGELVGSRTDDGWAFVFTPSDEVIEDRLKSLVNRVQYALDAGSWHSSYPHLEKITDAAIELACAVHKQAEEDAEFELPSLRARLERLAEHRG